jgi:hypothetical protein
MRSQLLALGTGRGAIEQRIAAHRLILIHPGVYAVGHAAVGSEGAVLAAVASVSPGAAASHWTAAWLHGLVERLGRLLHVASPRPRRPRPTVATHRASLPPEDLAVVRGIPVTTVARTLLDLSGIVGERKLRRLVKEAEFRRVTSTQDLQEVLARHPRRRGRRALARLVGDRTLFGHPTRSEMEDRFLEFCVTRGLPLPETNVELTIADRIFEIDCIWRDERVAVELDGRQAHATDSAFESDRGRDRALVAAGWTPTRVTWLQLHRETDALHADLAKILSDRRRFAHQIGA